MSRLVIESVNGFAFVNFSAFLGHPKTVHVAPPEKNDLGRKSKSRKKSKKKTERDNERAEQQGSRPGNDSVKEMQLLQKHPWGRVMSSSHNFFPFVGGPIGIHLFRTDSRKRDVGITKSAKKHYSISSI